MACLGVEPGAAEWKAQTNPLSYGGTPNLWIFASQTGGQLYSDTFNYKVGVLEFSGKSLWQYRLYFLTKNCCHLTSAETLFF